MLGLFQIQTASEVPCDVVCMQLQLLRIARSLRSDLLLQSMTARPEGAWIQEIGDDQGSRLSLSLVRFERHETVPLFSYAIVTIS
jgi:hypothetical protein